MKKFLIFNKDIVLKKFYLSSKAFILIRSRYKNNDIIKLIQFRIEKLTFTKLELTIIKILFHMSNFCLRLSLLVHKKKELQIVIRAAFLGTVFSIGIYISVTCPRNWVIFGWYICVLSFFHYSEYLSIAVTNPGTLTIDAFMLNHSFAYGVAASASWMEFFFENYMIPKVKDHIYISIIGLILCIMGEVLRKLAMFTANTNFNHIVQTVKERDHVLVTHGVYGLCRHPSYVGWFYWSIGTQLILVNPVCIVIYAVVSWLFFKNRLLIEEDALMNFFGNDYVEYKMKVHSGLPFNDDYRIEKKKDKTCRRIV
ncbi:hypothetical protein PGB90_003335 [Kerria lacca]